MSLGYIFSLAIGCIKKLWPLWLWLFSREMAGGFALGGEYYLSAITAGPLLLYLMFRVCIFLGQRHGTSALLWFSLGSVISGLLGFMAEYGRWQPYFGQSGYSLFFVVSNADHPLLIVSVIAVLAPILASCNMEWKIMLAKFLNLFSKNTHGSADWLPMSEARKKFAKSDSTDEPKADLVLGEAYIPSKNPKLGGKAPLLYFDGDGHLLTVSGSGGGKTVSVAKPNCLVWSGPLVAHDPKGELAKECAPTRKAMQAGRQVAILNPTDSGTFSFNVLGWLDPSCDQVIENARAVVAWLGDGKEPDGNSAYFHNEAAKLLQALILYVVTAPAVPSELRTLREVRRMVASKELPEFLELLHGFGEDFCFGVPARVAGEFLELIKLSPPQWGGIVGHAGEMTRWLDSPPLARLVCGSASGPTFSLNDFVAGKVDVFVCVPLITLEETPQAARLIIGSLLNAKYAQGVKDADNRILFLLDEMPRLKKMDILVTARDAGRGYGITLWSIVQDLGQLEEYYGKTGKRSWLENCKIKNFFGIGDIETAQTLSEMLGKKTIDVKNIGISDNGNTVGTSPMARDLMTPAEIMIMAVDKNGVPDEQLLFLRNSRPLKCGMAKYWRRPELAALIEKNKPEKEGKHD